MAVRLIGVCLIPDEPLTFPFSRNGSCPLVQKYQVSQRCSLDINVFADFILFMGRLRSKNMNMSVLLFSKWFINVYGSCKHDITLFWHISLFHILCSFSLPPGAQQKKKSSSVRPVEVYWSSRSELLQSAIMCRGDKSGHFFSFLVARVSIDWRPNKTPDNAQSIAQTVPRLVPDFRVCAFRGWI